MDIASFSLAAKANKRVTELTGDSRLSVPSGTTAERPALGAGDRAVRYNTDNDELEEWDGTQWKNVSAGIVSTVVGGTNVTIDNTDPTSPVINVPNTATIDDAISMAIALG